MRNGPERFNAIVTWAALRGLRAQRSLRMTLEPAATVTAEVARFGQAERDEEGRRSGWPSAPGCVNRA